jgi:hypothetical protein
MRNYCNSRISALVISAEIAALATKVNPDILKVTDAITISNRLLDDDPIGYMIVYGGQHVAQ